MTERRRADHAAGRLEAGGRSDPSPEISKAPGTAELRHDWVNVVALCVIFTLAAASLWDSEDSFGHTAVVALASTYLVVDIVWVLLQPAIVRAPKSIIAHHVVTLIVIGETVEHEMHRVNASRALLVEINTVLLTLRRRLGRPIWCEATFYATWGIFRLVWFPMIGIALLASTFGYDDQLQASLPTCLWIDVRSPPPIRAYASISFAVVVLLQYHWTFALFRTMLKGNTAQGDELLDGQQGSASSKSQDKKRRPLLLPALIAILLVAGLAAGARR